MKITVACEILLKSLCKNPINNASALFHKVIWTNEGLVYWRIYTPLVVNEFTQIVSLETQRNNAQWYCNEMTMICIVVFIENVAHD